MIDAEKNGLYRALAEACSEIASLKIRAERLEDRLAALESQRRLEQGQAAVLLDALRRHLETGG